MIGRRELLIGAGAAGLISAAPLRAASADPIAVTAAGRFRGRREAGIDAFRGIAYGRAERFRAPQPIAASRATIDALAFGPACPQRDAAGTVGEDCLALNIWTPEVHPEARRPVMVYIHGGAYANGSGSDPLTDGTRLAAARDVVVVTLNHRLNAFGYLYLGLLSDRFPDSGNAGQLDLILALRWIRANIAGFGGDPERVMLFGQSGGGAKIATLMGMPAADGLFHAAATMSGQQVTIAGPNHATARARAFMARIGVDRPERLIDLAPERLVEGLAATDPILGGSINWAPALDERNMVRHPFWPDANPQSNAIPMLLGNTHDEARAFFDPARAPLTGLDWRNIAERLAPELRVDIDARMVVARYRDWFPDFGPEDVFLAAVTAGRSWRGQVEEAEARARAGAPTWVYQLDFPAPLAPWKRAFHTLDIPLVFGTLDAPGSMPGAGREARRLSDDMGAVFAGMAHGRAPGWPRYDLARRATMIFDARPRVEDDPRGRERALFAKVPYVQPGS